MDMTILATLYTYTTGHNYVITLHIHITGHVISTLYTLTPLGNEISTLYALTLPDMIFQHSIHSHYCTSYFNHWYALRPMDIYLFQPLYTPAQLDMDISTTLYSLKIHWT